MINLDQAKEDFAKERREEASEQVTVRINSTTTHGFAFNVYRNDEPERIKYIGEISKDHLHDSCTCHSFMFGNSEDYQKK